MNMRKFLLLLLICLPLTAFAQQKQVRVVLRKGNVVEGTLLEFKAFEYLEVETEGKKVKIDYMDMAYIDVIDEETPAVETPAVETPNAMVAKAPESRKEKAPKVKKEKAPKEKKEKAPKVKKEKAPKVKKEKAPKVKSPKAGSPVAETAIVSTAETAIVSTAGTGFKGFLLERGNNVYLECISDPTSVAYNEAALDVLKRQMRRDGFWNIVERPEDAHFSIVYLTTLQGKTNVAIAINSRLTGKNEVLGEMNGSEDVAEYRKIVWELYNKYITPLHKKIDKGKAPNKLKKNFTL
jgi:outer membrane biosynthesis protein TonB